MEIKISIDENGRFQINKSPELSIFMAVGMIELAKKVMLEGGIEEKETEEVDVDVMQ